MADTKPPKVPSRREKGKWLPEQATKDRARQFLDRYEKGEMIYDLAKEAGISHQAAYKALLLHNREEWRAAQVSRAMAEYEQAKKGFEEAKQLRDAVALACAREALKAAQWELERLEPKMFAQKQEVSSAVPVTINIGISKDQGVVIDGQKVDGAEQ